MKYIKIISQLSRFAFQSFSVTLLENNYWLFSKIKPGKNAFSRTEIIFEHLFL